MVTWAREKSCFCFLSQNVNEKFSVCTRAVTRIIFEIHSTHGVKNLIDRVQGGASVRLNIYMLGTFFICPLAIKVC